MVSWFESCEEITLVFFKQNNKHKILYIFEKITKIILKTGFKKRSYKSHIVAI